MAHECINPSDLPTPPTYSHVVVATGSRLVFVAGQEPEDQQGNLVGSGDLAAQARQVFDNLGRALAAAAARPEQVTKITIYVVGYRHDVLPVIEAARVTLFGDQVFVAIQQVGGVGLTIAALGFVGAMGDLPDYTTRGGMLYVFALP